MTIIGIADAGIDHGLRAKTHCPNVCLLIILLLNRCKDSKINKNTLASIIYKPGIIKSVGFSIQLASCAMA